MARGKAAAPFILEALEGETDLTARRIAAALLRAADPPHGAPDPPDRLELDDNFIFERH
jgi:hypothetical protein